MTDNLQFDFIVDKNKNTITVRREFAADRQLVWDCHTKSELLDQWFAPKPLTTKTKSMDFSEGGHWHYAMVMPDGTEHWGYTKYSDINPIDSYRTVDAFANEAGEMNSDLPTATWNVSFTDFGDDDARPVRDRGRAQCRDADARRRDPARRCLPAEDGGHVPRPRLPHTVR